MRPSVGWTIRRQRMLQIVPLRQFLAKEKISISKEAIERELDAMKKDPNPFGLSPPMDLAHFMVKECMPFADLREVIEVRKGMQEFAERKWRAKWPADSDWGTHCKSEKKSLEQQAGMFRMLSLTLADWPKGARDQAEAMAIKQKMADECMKRVKAGESFDAVALSLVPGAKTSDEAAPRRYFPFDYFGKNHLDELRDLGEGEVAQPFKFPGARVILKRDVFSDEDARRILKNKYLKGIRQKTRDRLIKASTIEKVNWMTTKDLKDLDD